jgi:hypothetical protein
MKSLGLISQVFTLGLGLAIVFLYVMPTFEEIGVIQDDIVEYENLRKPVDEVNNLLAGYINTLDSLDQADKDRLAIYMPPFVDSVAVMRELQFIIEQSGMVFKSVDYGGSSEQVLEQANNEFAPVKHEFSVTTEGTYSQLKNFLSLLEQNRYPLEVHEADITPLEGGFLTLDLVLFTYANEFIPLE